MSRIYCVNLYKGLRIGNNGDMTFCCKSETPLTNKEGKPARPWNDDLSDVMHGPMAVEIREALEKGEKHRNCKKCWDEEAGNVKSKRQHDNDRCDTHWGKEYTRGDNYIAPEIVEFNLGTVCNLKCRICGPWSSSFWQKEYKDLVVIPAQEPGAIHLTEEQRIKGYKENLKNWGGDWSDDSPAWDNIEKYIPHMKKIDIFGGEPFLVEKQWKLFKKCVENGWSKNQYVNFNTNGTQYNEEYVNLLPEFQYVWISFSMDGVGKQFEYQRNPAKWEEVLGNIEKFKALRSKYPEKIVLNVCITVNTHNVYYIPEIIQFFRSIDIVPHLNFCHWPLHYNIKNIPEYAKDKIIEKYNSYDDEWVYRHTREIKGLLLSQISNADEWQKFIQKVKETDKYRGESFIDTFPEFAEIVGFE